MMNAAFLHDREAAVYVPFPVQQAEIQVALEGLRAIGTVGVNVTIPHKRSAFEYVTEKTPQAIRVGAVNTIRFSESGPVGHNTDVSGWWKSIEAHMPNGAIEMAVIGAGGAVMAILAAMSEYRNDARVKVIARREEAVVPLQRQFQHDLSVSHTPWEQIANAVSAANVIIQCTPVGMWPHVDDAPLEDASVFQPKQVVQDIVYRPLKTRFLEMAAQRGAVTVDGASMLIHQGIDAYEWWLSRPAPAQVMAQTVYARLREEEASR